jgi:bifunctional non-homologous end joining protein LigD
VWHSNRTSTRDLVAQLPVGFALTNLDKVLYEEEGLTKADVIAYLAVISEWMLPHAASRPIMLVRCPDGVGAECFHNKHAPIDDVRGLVELGQLGALEIHTRGCRDDRPDRPDRLVIDLDPAEDVGWARVIDAAKTLRAMLRELKLTSFVTTTGGKGLHVVTPLRRHASWDEHKAFARGIADALVAVEPKRYTAVLGKAARKGKIFVDYLRNGSSATFIAPYSMRARPRAPVATPLAWEELDDVDPASLTIQTVPARMGSLARDPWKALSTLRQSLPKGWHAAR